MHAGTFWIAPEAFIQIHPVAHAVRGASFVRKGDYDRALVDLNEALRLDPKNASVHNSFGVYYNVKGEYPRALAALNEAIRLNPRFLYAYKNRGVAYEGQGDLNKALVDFRMALSIDPEKKQTGGREAAEGIQRVEQKLAAVATQLPNPANDAADIARALSKLGFDVVEGRDLDKRAMEDKIREFGRKLERADLALLYYAGHGLQVAGKNYLARPY